MWGPFAHKDHENTWARRTAQAEWLGHGGDLVLGESRHDRWESVAINGPQKRRASWLQ